jgi:hypothetical protein
MTPNLPMLLFRFTAAVLFVATFPSSNDGPTRGGSGVVVVVSAQDAIPQSLQDVATQCPTEVLLVTPCINTDASVEGCAACLTNSVVQGASGSNLTEIPTDCSTLGGLVCDGVGACGSSCGLSTTGTLPLTFGSRCDDLFVSLIGCVVQSQGVGTNCTFGGTGACGGGGSDGSLNGTANGTDDSGTEGSGGLPRYWNGGDILGRMAVVAAPAVVAALMAVSLVA